MASVDEGTLTNLSPETLQEEGPEERHQRERQTGVLGNGHNVICHPTGDPEVYETKNRVQCLLKPFPACGSCAHGKFRMVFNADPNAKLKQVQCPRWRSDAARMVGEQPVDYVKTELATCADKPFPYCVSCPSLENLSKMFIDKQKDGWYARYRRFSKDEEADDD